MANYSRVARKALLQRQAKSRALLDTLAEIFVARQALAEQIVDLNKVNWRLHDIACEREAASHLAQLLERSPACADVVLKRKGAQEPDETAALPGELLKARARVKELSELSQRLEKDAVRRQSVIDAATDELLRRLSPYAANFTQANLLVKRERRKLQEINAALAAMKPDA